MMRSHLICRRRQVQQSTSDRSTKSGGGEPALVDWCERGAFSFFLAGFDALDENMLLAGLGYICLKCCVPGKGRHIVLISCNAV
jgi:hypothetical protein